MTAFGYKQAGQGAFDAVHPMGEYFACSSSSWS